MSRKHWLATYGEKIPAEIDPNAHRSVLDLLETAMRRYADKPAFHCFGEILTYADTDRLSRDFAAYLQNKLGVERVHVHLHSAGAHDAEHRQWERRDIGHHHGDAITLFHARHQLSG